MVTGSLLKSTVSSPGDKTVCKVCFTVEAGRRGEGRDFT